MTLLSETIEALTRAGLGPNDVRWVGAAEVGWMSWAAFAEVADVEYDSGYGWQEVAEDLLVVGDGWWLSRGEYDGSEWWNFNSPPVKPHDEIHPESVVPESPWSSLREVHPKQKVEDR